MTFLGRGVHEGLYQRQRARCRHAPTRFGIEEGVVGVGAHELQYISEDSTGETPSNKFDQCDNTSVQLRVVSDHFRPWWRIRVAGVRSEVGGACERGC